MKISSMCPFNIKTLTQRIWINNRSPCSTFCRSKLLQILSGGKQLVGGGVVSSSRGRGMADSTVNTGIERLEQFKMTESKAWVSVDNSYSLLEPLHHLFSIPPHPPSAPTLYILHFRLPPTLSLLPIARTSISSYSHYLCSFVLLSRFTCISPTNSPPLHPVPPPHFCLPPYMPYSVICGYWTEPKATCISYKPAKCVQYVYRFGRNPDCFYTW
jgi:hypothetical protein